MTAVACIVFASAAVLTGVGTPFPTPLQMPVAAGAQEPIWGWLTSELRCSGLAAYGTTLAAIPVLLGLAERRLGRRTAVIGLFVGQLLATAIGLGIIAALPGANGWVRQLPTEVVVGPLPGLLAVFGLATARLPDLWRRRLRVSASVGLCGMVFYSGTAGDITRLTGWLLGLAAGALVRRADDSPQALHATRREVRALVALVLAVSALGPVVAVYSRAPGGPFATAAHLFVSGHPHGLLAAVCGRPGDPAECRGLRAQYRLTGGSGVLLSILPVLLQLLLAEGLRRGRRAAWVAAVCVTALLTAVGGATVVAVLRRPAELVPLMQVRRDSLPAFAVGMPLAVPLVLLTLLLVTRSRFQVRAAPGAGRRWLLTATAGLAAVMAAYVSISRLIPGSFVGYSSPGALLLDMPQRMLPPGYLGQLLPPLMPFHHVARVVADWCCVAAWSVLVLTAVRLVRPAAETGDSTHARSLVSRFGDGPLSFMTTWTGNNYWFTDDRQAMVAYRVHGGVALTTGDPIGEPRARTAAVQGFAAWCDNHGWTPCWYSVTEEVATALAATGARRVQVALEAWLPLGALAFSGRRWQDVRTAINRARREGVEASWTTWSDAPLAVREQIVSLSEEWLAGKGLPEMGFTLGGLDELEDHSVRCLLAVDQRGAVHGLTSWLPAQRDGTTVGWTLDVMRRAGNAGPGTIEFLIATAALTFQDEGAEWVSLSGAPLAVPREAVREPLTRVLEMAGRTMEPVYGFRSLLAFKTKFQPERRPLWMVYPATADLPRIARAVAHAYLPHLSPAQAIRLAGAVLRGHRQAPRTRQASTHMVAPVPGSLSGGGR